MAEPRTLWSPSSLVRLSNPFGLYVADYSGMKRGHYVAATAFGTLWGIMAQMYVYGCQFNHPEAVLHQLLREGIPLAALWCLEDLVGAHARFSTVALERAMILYHDELDPIPTVVPRADGTPSVEVQAEIDLGIRIGGVPMRLQCIFDEVRVKPTALLYTERKARGSGVSKWYIDGLRNSPQLMTQALMARAIQRGEARVDTPLPSRPSARVAIEVMETGVSKSGIGYSAMHGLFELPIEDETIDGWLQQVKAQLTMYRNMWDASMFSDAAFIAGELPFWPRAIEDNWLRTLALAPPETRAAWLAENRI